MHVYGTLDDYYNYHFSDDEKYQCFRTWSREQEDSFYGYVEIGSEVAGKMKGVLPDRGALPVRLKMRFLPQTKDKRMVEIVDFFHSYWVDPETIEQRLEN